MNLFRKWKQTHRHRKQTWLPKVKGGGGGGYIRQIQIIIYKLEKQPSSYCISTGNCTQYPIVNNNGKEYEKEYVDIYV